MYCHQVFSVWAHSKASVFIFLRDMCSDTRGTAIQMLIGGGPKMLIDGGPVTANFKQSVNTV